MDFVLDFFKPVFVVPVWCAAVGILLGMAICVFLVLWFSVLADSKQLVDDSKGPASWGWMIVGAGFLSVGLVFLLSVFSPSLFWEDESFESAGAGLTAEYGVPVEWFEAREAYQKPGVGVKLGSVYSGVASGEGSVVRTELELVYDLVEKRFTVFETVAGVLVGEFKGK